LALEKTGLIEFLEVCKNYAPCDSESVENIRNEITSLIEAIDSSFTKTKINESRLGYVDLLIQVVKEKSEQAEKDAKKDSEKDIKKDLEKKIQNIKDKIDSKKNKLVVDFLNNADQKVNALRSSSHSPQLSKEKREKINKAFLALSAQSFQAVLNVLVGKIKD